MGIEIIYPIAIALGLGLFVLLLVRSCIARSRPYALPTLIAATAFALVLNIDGHKAGYYWEYLIMWFCLGAIMFGLHAHMIKWIVARQAKTLSS